VSHLEISRFELKVIDGEAIPLRPANRVLEAAPANLLPAAQHEEIVRANQQSSPVVILEEVEPARPLDPRLVVLADPSSPQARSYRLLQHRLIATSDPRVIAVTSARPGEGKTTCAANLALTLADETFARVLLVEANTRRPGLAEAFGFSPADSLINRLQQERDAKPPYFVARVRGTRLHVAALQVDAARDTRLDRLLLGLALSELRNFYQYIVLDGAAVFDSPDADVAGECADGVLVTARARKSQRRDVRRAIAQLSPTPVLGVVLLDT
jgi:Mrp family chromosome partitioning ATPase